MGKSQQKVKQELAALGQPAEKVSDMEAVLPADVEALIDTYIVAQIPLNRNNDPEGVTDGIIESIKVNPVKKNAYTITLDNGERVAWTKGNKTYVWVQGMNKSKTTVENSEKNVNFVNEEVSEESIFAKLKNNKLEC